MMMKRKENRVLKEDEDREYGTIEDEKLEKDVLGSGGKRKMLLRGKAKNSPTKNNEERLSREKEKSWCAEVLEEVVGTSMRRKDARIRGEVTILVRFLRENMCKEKRNVKRSQKKFSQVEVENPLIESLSTERCGPTMFQSYFYPMCLLGCCYLFSFDIMRGASPS